MQPVQDLTVENRVSRTRVPVQRRGRQRRRTRALGAEIARAAAASCLAHRRRQRRPGAGLAGLRRHRPALGYLEITTATIGSARSTTPAQRLVSTIFTQSNLYRRLVLEVKPDYKQGLAALDGDIWVANGPRRRCRASAAVIGRAFLRAHRALSINAIGQFPAAALAFNQHRRLLRRCGQGDRRRRA